jgi:hypothetical protein
MRVKSDLSRSQHKKEASIMRSTLLLGLALFALSAGAAYAAGDHIGRTALVVGDDGKEAQTVFATDAPKIVLHAELKGAEAGAKVEGIWIAVKTDAAPANYKIDAATLTLDSSALEEVTFSLSKPTAGWPVGTYQVDLTYNGTAEKSVPFSVEK